MYDTILVPLDGSGRAEAILPHVIELAQSLGSKLVLMRVVDPTISYSGLEGLPVEVTRDIINQELEAIWAGKKTAKKGLDDAANRGNKLLRKFEKANK